MPLLDVTALSIELPAEGRLRSVVDDVTLSLEAGEILGIAGESGSGKTMTGLALIGLLPKQARVNGSVSLAGVNLLSLPERERRRTRGRDVAMVFQDPMSSLHPMLSIERQLTDHVRHHEHVGRHAARQRALELLDRVRLPATKRTLDSYPHQLSGGMRQRVAIAMALACRPKLIIADEPTTALDVTVQAGILELLDELRQAEDIGIVVITHDLGVLSSLADQIAVFYAGRVIEKSSDVGAVFREPRHPYTRALLDALPAHDPSGLTLTPIPGLPPALTDDIAGCSFEPRCRFARPACTSALPPLRAVGAGRALACAIDPWGNEA